MCYVFAEDVVIISFVSVFIVKSILCKDKVIKSFPIKRKYSKGYKKFYVTYNCKTASNCKYNYTILLFEQISTQPSDTVDLFTLYLQTILRQFVSPLM